MKVFVLGPRYSGKTPFSIQVSAATGLQHIEALNWLRSHFAHGEFALMLHDHELMNRMTLEELEIHPKACAHYVASKLSVGRSSLVDGLFTEGDFVEFFDPSKDWVVEVQNSSVIAEEPTSYEQKLEDIKKHLVELIVDHRFDPQRMYRYKLAAFHRGKNPRQAKSIGGFIQCAGLDDAVEHFVAQLRVSGALAKK